MDTKMSMDNLVKTAYTFMYAAFHAIKAVYYNINNFDSIMQAQQNT